MRLYLISLIVLFVSCVPSPETAFFEVTTYNAYALFDGYDDGTEFDGFSHSDGYDGEAYRNRIRELAVLLGRDYSTSDVIILQEVESVEVLSDLLDAGLDEKGYQYYGLADDGSGGLYVGFISKTEPLSGALHFYPGCRPILELSFLSNGEVIRIFGVHFRSQLDGGDSERYEQSMHLSHLMEESAGILSIAVGDFNFDPRLTGPFTLFPDLYNPDNAFHITGDPSKAGEKLYYSPLVDPDIILTEKGTYFYEGSWYLYDNVLMTSECWDGKGFEYDSVEIKVNRNMKDMLDRPLKYDSSIGYGYSDHFPVTLRIRAK